jgi:hypothetical protein
MDHVYTHIVIYLISRHSFHLGRYILVEVLFSWYLPSYGEGSATLYGDSGANAAAMRRFVGTRRKSRVFALSVSPRIGTVRRSLIKIKSFRLRTENKTQKANFLSLLPLILVVIINDRYRNTRLLARSPGNRENDGETTQRSEFAERLRSPNPFDGCAKASGHGGRQIGPIRHGSMGSANTAPGG